jgi:hypothetical protein
MRTRECTLTHKKRPLCMQMPSDTTMAFVIVRNLQLMTPCWESDPFFSSSSSSSSFLLLFCLFSQTLGGCFSLSLSLSLSMYMYMHMYLHPARSSIGACSCIKRLTGSSSSSALFPDHCFLINERGAHLHSSILAGPGPLLC